MCACRFFCHPWAYTLLVSEPARSQNLNKYIYIKTFFAVSVNFYVVSLVFKKLENVNE